MDSPNPIDRIVMIDTEREDLRVTLVARIDETGDLILEGYDRGAYVEKMWGNSDYEYWLKIPAAYKDTILLHLLNERFETDSKFMEWLKDKKIPYDFSTWR